MRDAFDFGDAHLEFGNLPKDWKPEVGSISTPSGSSTSESIVTSIDLDVEAKITCETLKTQLILNQKKRVLHHMLSFPWHFFVVNDDKKPNLVLPQAMHYVICCYVY
jgi:hypothetical protein